MGLWRFCVTALAVLALSSSAFLQAQEPIPIEIADLPKPPEAIQALIELGRVTFEAGQRESATQPTNRPRITAETHYRVVYNYHSRSRWKVNLGTRRVVIHVSYARVEWKPIHKIWFRKRPEPEGFWSNKLVLHEFDHVRISSDRRLAVRFEQMLRNKNVLSRTFRSGDVVDRKYVERLVDRHVAELFSEISDLISIRYKELDRVTNHGLAPVPSDSPLIEFLRLDPAGSQ